VSKALATSRKTAPVSRLSRKTREESVTGEGTSRSRQSVGRTHGEGDHLSVEGQGANRRRGRAATWPGVKKVARASSDGIGPCKDPGGIRRVSQQLCMH
jgi:hypothetical protein